MTNLVEITVRATGPASSDWTKIRAGAAKAGDDAGKAFNDAFKLKADATIKEKLEGSGGLSGSDDKSLVAKLKSYASNPGGIGIIGTGSDSSLLNMLKSQIRAAGSNGSMGLLGGQSSTDAVKQVLQNSVGGNTSSNEFVKQVLQNNVTSNTSSQDLVREVLANNVTGNVSTKDFINQVLTGNTPGNVTTKDVIKTSVDKSSLSSALSGLGGSLSDSGKGIGGDLSEGIHEGMDNSKSSFRGWASDIGGDLLRAIKDFFGIHSPATSTVPIGSSLMQGIQSGMKSGASALKSTLSSILGDLTKSSGGGLGNLLKGSGGNNAGGALGAVSGTLDAGGIAGGALPGIGPISGLAATVTGLAGALVAVLPAITSVVAGLGAIGGGFAILELTNKKFASDISSTLTTIEGVFKSAVAPLAGPLEEAAKQIGVYFKQLGPVFKQIFGDSGQLVKPLVSALEGLISGVLPGFLALIKAGTPVFEAFAESMSGLGKDLGSMFSDFAAASGPSATILKALVGLIGSLLPFIGELAKILAGAVAPAVTAFSSALSAVLPALKPLLSIIGSLAGAALTDLAGVLGSVGSLLVDLAPSFTLLAKAADEVFTALENDGVFASLGNAVEGLAGPLAGLTNALVRDLAPALPGLIAGFSAFAKVFTGGVVVAITAVADSLTAIINAVPVPVIVALVDAFAVFKTTMLAFSAISALPGIFTAITAAVTVMTAAFDFSTIALKAMYAWDVIVTVATKAWAAAQLILNAILDLNPFVAIGVAVAVLAALIIKYHTQIWNFIVKTWNDVESFVKSVWDSIKNDAETVWNDITGFFVAINNDERSVFESVWNAIYGFFRSIWGDIEELVRGAAGSVERTLSNAWDSVYSTVRSMWGDIVNFFSGIPGKIVRAVGNAGSVLYNWGKGVLNGLISGFDAIWSAVANFFKSLPGDILGWLGIHSPPQWAIEAGQHIASGIGIGIGKAQGRVKTATQALAAIASKTVGGLAGVPAQGGPTEAQDTAMKMAALIGWTGGLWTDLNNVAMRESGWSMTAQNSSSGAYGIAQFIDGPSEYAQYGGNANTLSGQLVAFFNYIKDRYGSPAGAWAHEVNYGWYDKGGWLQPGYTLAYNGTGKPEAVGGVGGVNVTLEIASTGNADLDAVALAWLRKTIRIKGGGNVQRALGIGQ
jgi:phage-related protein